MSRKKHIPVLFEKTIHKLVDFENEHLFHHRKYRHSRVEQRYTRFPGTNIALLVETKEFKIHQKR